jgi:hypothetical protein
MADPCRGEIQEKNVFGETGAVAADGARKAWYFGGGILVLGLAVGLGMLCAYISVSLGLQLILMSRNLDTFAQNAWLPVVLKVPIAVASFWLAQKFARQTYRLWNVASSSGDLDTASDRTRQQSALKIGAAANDPVKRKPALASVGTSPAPAATRMRELKECLEAGVITPAEFETKRAEILRSL